MNQDVIGSGVPGDNAFPPVETLTYEQARAELDDTVAILERGQMGLEESLSYWERGEALVRRCEEHLANARRTVEQALARRNSNLGDDTASNSPTSTP